MNDETARTARLIELYLRRAISKFPSVPLEVEIILLSALVVAFIYAVLWWLYV
jgi:hypothetical protein